MRKDMNGLLPEAHVRIRALETLPEGKIDADIIAMFKTHARNERR